MSLASLWILSRPRFWIYLLGPYLVGTVAAWRETSALPAPVLLLFVAYFTLPANLLVYGINDRFDYETDRRNPKKQGYEGLVPPEKRRALWQAIAVTNLPFALALPALPSSALLWFGAFVALSVFYSAPPIRAKARPLLDSLFNFLYACPGAFAFVLAGGQVRSPLPLLAALCWTMAMHAYSAVPDIAADKESQTPTIATWLGLNGTLWLCTALYAAAAALAYPALGLLAPLLGSVYLCLMALSLQAGTEAGVMRLYRRFPLINTLCGMAVFFAAATRS